ncbi:hypothetical protein [Actinophytocola xanthii]|uniref:hypothetical protein n=1 Tax=Actinophytocola xanthii TaxID=1912961 RepID=UPI0013011B3B|nr:hypothetical protein [Actinophytocola xanthii]
MHGNENLDDDGAREAVEAMIQQRYRRALTEVDRLPVDEPVRAALLELAAAATVRSS